MTSLTEQQQELVAQNLPIVHWVICDYIHVNPTICGMEYGDLFQEGCLWLCKAASTYKNDGRAQFSTYAKTVVKNGLLSYCRAICNRKKKFSRLIIGEHGELAADGEALESRPDAFDTQVSLIETLSLLDACKKDYDGVTRLGIEALASEYPGHNLDVGAWISRSPQKPCQEYDACNGRPPLRPLKLQGMRVTDIAELYQVPPSHVGAWISRSTAKLRRDSKFLKSLL